MLKEIIKELREHAPFTVFGAIMGIIFMMAFYNIPSKIAHNVFYIFHPMHVALSALVTSSMYELHRRPETRLKYNIWFLIIIGYVGSVGIATLSDSIIPYLGEAFLDLPNRKAHIGFIEEWWLINPMAILGIAIAYFKPFTKFPHSAHVLLSTWASLFHIIMAISGRLNWYAYIIIFAFLFIAVWLPCCVSDIVFPLLFVKNGSQARRSVLKNRS